jgi:hypothetical protein
MAKITIQLDVLNSKEIVRNRKGKLVGFVASIFMKEEDLKRKIEEKITEDIVRGLKETLHQRLKEEGVAASLKISVIE